MGKIILNLATSLDGFIADEKGGVDWLSDFNRPDEDYGMKAFFAQCGAAVMGAKTYEQTLSFNYWYGNMEGIIFTNRELPTLEDKKIGFYAGDPGPVIKSLRERKKDSWLVGGASLISQFINRGLLDEIIITVVPRLLGKGSLLCPDIKNIVKLRFLDHKNYPDGVIQLHYHC